jgi:predicted RNA-binding Zn-ribbon protein involved in translation (DUF1610 family)
MKKIEDYETAEGNLVTGYKDGENLYKDFTVREMDGRDTEAVAEVKNNGAKFLRTLVTRCCVRIGDLHKEDYKRKEDWTKIVQGLTTMDRDTIVLKIREISVGEEIESNAVCPQCGQKIVNTITLDEVPFVEFDGDFIKPVELPKGLKDKNGEVHTTGTFRLPNTLDAEVLDPVLRKNVATADTLLLARCLKLDGVTMYNDIARDLTVKDRKYLFDIMKDMKCGYDFIADVDCPQCGHAFKANLNLVDFI